MHEGPRSRLVAYGVAMLATAVSLLVRWPLWPVLGDRALYMAFFPAVLIAAYFGGFGPGLLATSLGALAATGQDEDRSDGQRCADAEKNESDECARIKRAGFGRCVFSHMNGVGWICLMYAFERRFIY